MGHVGTRPPTVGALPPGGARGAVARLVCARARLLLPSHVPMASTAPPRPFDLLARRARLPLLRAMQERVLVCDGAMGTMIQGFSLGADDFDLYARIKDDRAAPAAPSAQADMRPRPTPAPRGEGVA